METLDGDAQSWVNRCPHSLGKLQPGITLDELRESEYNCDEVYTLIAQNHLNVNWRGVNIAQQGSQLQIFPVNQKASRTETTKLRGASTLELAPNLVDLKPGSPVVWNGKSLSILNRGETHTALLNEEAKVIQLEIRKLTGIRGL